MAAYGEILMAAVNMSTSRPAVSQCAENAQLACDCFDDLGQRRRNDSFGDEVTFGASAWASLIAVEFAARAAAVLLWRKVGHAAFGTGPCICAGAGPAAGGRRPN